MVHTKLSYVILSASFEFTFVQKAIQSLKFMHIIMILVDLTSILEFTIRCDVLIVLIFKVLVGESSSGQVLRESGSLSVE